MMTIQKTTGNEHVKKMAHLGFADFEMFVVLVDDGPGRSTSANKDDTLNVRRELHRSFAPEIIASCSRQVRTGNSVKSYETASVG
jgi:hypothetical protein